MTPPTTAATRMLGVHIDPVRFEVIRNALLAITEEMGVDVLFATSTPAIHALAEATTTVPIVILSAGDPVDAGFVASLARPGGTSQG